MKNVRIHSVYWWRIHYPEGHLTRDEVNAINTYTLENLEGFVIGRTDWEYIRNSFISGPRWGSASYIQTRLQAAPEML